jgi:hypothetical protein
MTRTRRGGNVGWQGNAKSPARTEPPNADPLLPLRASTNTDTATDTARRCQKLWTILKVHRVVVIPFATPDKSVTLEDLHDSVWNPISVGNDLIAIPSAVPTPVIGVVRININRDAEGMRAELIGSGDRPPVESAASLENVLLILRRELIEFGRYGRQLAVNPIHSSDTNGVVT